MIEQIYLASASPRRKELLTQLGVSFIQVANAFDETPLPDESPEQYVQRLAEGKARSAIAYCDTDNPLPILGADTIVVYGGELLGKPTDEEAAKRMLRKLSGKRHQVFSGVCLYHNHKSYLQCSKSEVSFCELSDAMIDAYCASGEPFGKAGSYAIQGKAASFVSQISGSYTGIVGLPLYETRLLLDQLQIKHSLAPQ